MSTHDWETNIDMVAGAFYLTEDLRYDTFADLFGALPVGLALPLRAASNRDTKTWALFSELTVNLSDAWSVKRGPSLYPRKQGRRSL